jgi:hypothetical protein
MLLRSPNARINVWAMVRIIVSTELWSSNARPSICSRSCPVLSIIVLMRLESSENGKAVRDVIIHKYDCCAFSKCKHVCAHGYLELEDLLFPDALTSLWLASLLFSFDHPDGRINLRSMDKLIIQKRPRHIIVHIPCSFINCFPANSMSIDNLGFSLEKKLALTAYDPDPNYYRMILFVIRTILIYEMPIYFVNIRTHSINFSH